MMSKIRGGPCAKLGATIRSQDLFAVPVSLTYRGETAFNTFCGGCISILLILSLMGYFAVELHREYVHPEYQQNPTRYEFNSTSIMMHPQYGNTIAINLNRSQAMSDLIHQEMRV